MSAPEHATDATNVEIKALKTCCAAKKKVTIKASTAVKKRAASKTM